MTASGEEDAPEIYQLSLFVSGATPRSTRAIDNLRKVCEEELKGRYVLEVIDIYSNPEAVRENQVIAAPTLIKQLPLPVRRIIGDLADKERVLKGLNLQTVNGPEAARAGRSEP
jgi:circadian clock protein KaiB